MALTKRAIDALRYDPKGPKRQVHYDTGGVPGFGVQVSPTGVRTFILNYRSLGSPLPKRLTIGRYGALTLEQARDIARDELHRAKKGDDPVERKRKARLAGRHSITVKEFAPIYLHNARTKGNPGRKNRRPKKSWRTDERRIERHILPVWGRRRLAEITRTDVRRLHNSIPAQYEANRVLNLVSVMWEAARMLGHVDEDAPNPARGITPFEEKARDRYVTEAEMPALAAAIEAEENEHFRAAFWLYLTTGLRRAELAQMRWDDVDMSARIIKLPDPKGGKPEIRVLPTAAAQLLEQLPRLLGNSYVLPSPTKPGAHIHPDAITKAWARVRARLWLAQHPGEAKKLRTQARKDVAQKKRATKHASDRPEAVEARLVALASDRATADPNRIRLHDLRRTVGSWLAMYGGASLPLIGAVLGHRNTATTEVYARFKNEAARATLDAHGEMVVAFLRNGTGAP